MKSLTKKIGCLMLGVLMVFTFNLKPAFAILEFDGNGNVIADRHLSVVATGLRMYEFAGPVLKNETTLEYMVNLDATGDTATLNSANAKFETATFENNTPSLPVARLNITSRFSGQVDAYIEPFPFVPGFKSLNILLTNGQGTATNSNRDPVNLHGPLDQEYFENIIVLVFSETVGADGQPVGQIISWRFNNKFQDPRYPGPEGAFGFYVFGLFALLIFPGAIAIDTNSHINGEIEFLN